MSSTNCPRCGACGASKTPECSVWVCGSIEIATRGFDQSKSCSKAERDKLQKLVWNWIAFANRLIAAGDEALEYSTSKAQKEWTKVKRTMP